LEDTHFIDGECCETQEVCSEPEMCKRPLELLGSNSEIVRRPLLAVTDRDISPNTCSREARLPA
jgi:hypothetical protein